ncbi:MAG: hypothetical protein WDZ69_02090 [Candidatus Pacearchaeota archaeon]
MKKSVTGLVIVLIVALVLVLAFVLDNKENTESLNLVEEYPALRDDIYREFASNDPLSCEGEEEKMITVSSENEDPSIPFGGGNVEIRVIDCGDSYFIQAMSGVIFDHGPFSSDETFEDIRERISE